jgi:Domain of unknown function (DU1801)
VLRTIADIVGNTMAEQKTKKTGVSVEAFLDAVPDAQKRADSYALLKMMKAITGATPKMWGPSIVGFGEYHYVYESGHEGDCCLTGFSPRKAALTLYFMAGLEERFAAQLKKLGKCKVSKGCLYIKKLADIDLVVLRGMIEANVKHLAAMAKTTRGEKAKNKRSEPEALAKECPDLRLRFRL